MPTRRDFLSRSALIAGGIGASALIAEAGQSSESVKVLGRPKNPVIVTRHTGDGTIDEAYRMLQDGADTLDAAHHICLGRENDPK